MLFQGGFSFPNFVTDVFTVFVFILWFWLFITVASDLLRRDDVPGLGKVLWIIVLLVLPYVGVFVYLLTQGRGMAARNEVRARRAEDNQRQVAGFSVADEIEKLDRLKAAGTISDQEYSRVRTRLMQ